MVLPGATAAALAASLALAGRVNSLRHAARLAPALAVGAGLIVGVPMVLGSVPGLIARQGPDRYWAVAILATLLAAVAALFARSTRATTVAGAVLAGALPPFLLGPVMNVVAPTTADQALLVGLVAAGAYVHILGLDLSLRRSPTWTTLAGVGIIALAAAVAAFVAGSVKIAQLLGVLIAAMVGLALAFPLLEAKVRTLALALPVGGAIAGGWILTLGYIGDVPPWFFALGVAGPLIAPAAWLVPLPGPRPRPRLRLALFTVVGAATPLAAAALLHFGREPSLY